jgi:hypothetical protein
MYKFFMVSTMLMSLMLSSSVYAANQGSGVHEPGTGITNPELKEEAQGTGQGLKDTIIPATDEVKIQQQVQQKLQDVTGAGTGNQVQNQMQNQGEINQVKNTEQTGVQGQNKIGNVDNTQRKSQVASAVSEMLNLADRNGGIGQEIKVIAQAQNQNQEKIENGLLKVQSRSGFAKFFIGPKDNEIKNTKELLTQKQEQIKQLVELKNQLKNEGDQKTLEEQIKILEQANIEIEATLEKEQKGFSLFGWLFK